MSYGEAITRNDLKAVLDEVLPVSFSLSSVKEVTLPFTPTSNGLLLVLIRAVNQGRFYVSYSNATPGLADAYQVAGGYTTAVSFVEKGKQVAQTDSMNLQQKFFYFVSLGNDSLADYVVEQGSNSNGTYRKWNSGFCECWGSASISSGGYTGKWTFPCAFVNKDKIVVHMTPVDSTSTAWNVNYGATTTTQADIGRTPSSATNVYYMSAVGTWK